MKYKLTNDFETLPKGTKIYRIQALKQFNDVQIGDLGGYIEKEYNLSQEGNCWVYGKAWVSGNAQVFGNAQVYGSAWVFEDARVYGNARVFEDARVYGNARVFRNAWVYRGKIAFGSWDRQPIDEELLWCGADSEVSKLLFY
jgi:hypothetical protein